MKKILLTLFVFMTILPNMYSQYSEVSENNELIETFVKTGNVKVVSQDYAQKNSRLNFKGYKSLSKNDIKWLKFTSPTYIIINPKAKKGKEVKQKINRKSIFTDLKFEWYKDDGYLVVLNESEAIYTNPKSKDSKMISINFKDMVVKQYIDERSNQSIFFVKMKIDGKDMITTFYADDLDPKVKKGNYQLAKTGYEKTRVEQIKNFAQDWNNGYFKQIFPNDSLYIYTINYRAGEFQEGFTEYDIGEIDLKTIGISNKKNIQLEDLINEDNSFKPISFNFEKALNVYSLMAKNHIFSDSLLVSNEFSSSAARYWKGDFKDVDSKIRKEAKDMSKSLINYTKFDSLYFAKKFKNIELWKKTHLSLGMYINGNTIYFNFSSKIPMLARFPTPSNKYDYDKYKSKSSIEVSKISDNKIVYEFENFEEAGSYSVGKGVDLKNSKGSYDIRIDSLDFSFVHVLPLPLEGYQDRNILIQWDKEKLKEFVVGKSIHELKYYYDYLMEEQSNSQRNSRALEKLYAKYGKKYVDEAVKGNIIVGMPLDLLSIPLKFWSFTNKTSYNNYYTLYFESKLDTSSKMSVSIKNNKVESVSTW